MFFSFYIRLHLSFDQKIYLTGKKVNVKEILPAFYRYRAWKPSLDYMEADSTRFMVLGGAAALSSR